MGFFDKRSDTERELEEYYKNRENQGAYDFDNSNNSNINNNNVPNIHTMKV